jgi:hypothetical protein
VPLRSCVRHSTTTAKELAPNIDSRSIPNAGTLNARQNEGVYLACGLGSLLLHVSEQVLEIVDGDAVDFSGHGGIERLG